MRKVPAPRRTARHGKQGEEGGPQPEQAAVADEELVQALASELELGNVEELSPTQGPSSQEKCYSDAG